MSFNWTNLYSNINWNGKDYFRGITNNCITHMVTDSSNNIYLSTTTTGLPSYALILMLTIDYSNSSASTPYFNGSLLVKHEFEYTTSINADDPSILAITVNNGYLYYSTGCITGTNANSTTYNNAVYQYKISAGSTGTPVKYTNSNLQIVKGLAIINKNLFMTSYNNSSIYYIPAGEDFSSLSTPTLFTNSISNPVGICYNDYTIGVTQNNGSSYGLSLISLNIDYITIATDNGNNGIVSSSSSLYTGCSDVVCKLYNDELIFYTCCNNNGSYNITQSTWVTWQDFSIANTSNISTISYLSTGITFMIYSYTTNKIVNTVPLIFYANSDLSSQTSTYGYFYCASINSTTTNPPSLIEDEEASHNSSKSNKSHNSSKSNKSHKSIIAKKSLNEFIKSTFTKGAQLMLSDDISFKQSMLIAMIGLIIKKYSTKRISKKILLKMFKLLTGK
jgi:hypothetical protein